MPQAPGAPGGPFAVAISVPFRYAVKEGNFSPKALSINGKAVCFICEENQYRQGGATLPSEQFLALLDRPENVVEVTLQGAQSA